MLTTKVAAAFKRMRETMPSMKMRCKKGLHTCWLLWELSAARIKLGMLMLIKSRQVPRKVIFNKVAYLHKLKGKIMAIVYNLFGRTLSHQLILSFGYFAGPWELQSKSRSISPTTTTLWLMKIITAFWPA